MQTILHPIFLINYTRHTWTEKLHESCSLPPRMNHAVSLLLSRSPSGQESMERPDPCSPATGDYEQTRAWLAGRPNPSCPAKLSPASLCSRRHELERERERWERGVELIWGRNRGNRGERVSVTSAQMGPTRPVFSFVSWFVCLRKLKSGTDPKSSVPSR